MRKDLVGAVFALMVTVSACQAPVQTTNPDGSLTKQEYSKRFVSLYKDYTKSNAESVKSSGIVLSAGQSANPLSAMVPTSLVPNSSAPTTPAPSASSMPGGAENPLAAAMGAEQLSSYKQMMKLGIDSIVRMETKLNELKPPSELSDKHTLVLDYFKQTRELGQGMLQIFEDPDPAAMLAFVAKYKGQAEKLTHLQSQILDILFEFSVDAYRQDRVALQKGGMLSRNAYLLKMRSLISKLPSGEGGPEILMTEALKPQLNETSDAKRDQQTLMLRLKSTLEQCLEELAEIYPPEDFETHHTAIYASTRLQIELLGKLAGLAGTLANSQTPVESPQALITSMLSDSALIDLFNELAVFMPKSKEALERVVKG